MLGTFALICVGWVFFRAANLADAAGAWSVGLDGFDLVHADFLVVGVSGKGVDVGTGRSGVAIAPEPIHAQRVAADRGEDASRKGWWQSLRSRCFSI